MENPKFVLKKSVDNQYYFTLQAENGQVLVTSEMYTQKHNAKKGIASTILNMSLIMLSKFEKSDWEGISSDDIFTHAKELGRIDDQSGEE